MVSVVLPVFNEMQSGFLPKITQSLFGVRDVEKIAVDGGSSDGTVEFLKEEGFEIFKLPNSNRADRLKLGIQSSKGQMIVLHHPRSFLQPQAWAWLAEHYNESLWGGFTHQFNRSHWLLKFTSWYSNRVRSRRGIIYLDHCIFFSKSMIPNCRVIPSVEIFEDTEISKILFKNFSTPQVVPIVSTTSAVRFEINGLYKQAMLNQVLKIKYWLGYSDKRMNNIYEKGIFLNNQSDDSQSE